MVTVITKESDSIITTVDGVRTNVQSVRREDVVISYAPSSSYEEVFNIVRETSTGYLIVYYNSSSITIDPSGGMTGAQIVTALEALGPGSRLSHDKLDDASGDDHHTEWTSTEHTAVGDSAPHHTKYTDAEAKVAAVLAGAITDSETKAPTHDAVFDVKATADGAIAKSLLTTRGDIIYRNASAPARLPKGASGNILRMGASDPAWGAELGVTYTELDGSDTTTADAQGATDGVWVDWDISAIVPFGTSHIELAIQKLGATDDVGAREKASGLVREFNVLKFGYFVFTVTCDANRVIEIMSDDVSDLDVFSIIGYWT